MLPGDFCEQCVRLEAPHAKRLHIVPVSWTTWKWPVWWSSRRVRPAAWNSPIRTGPRGSWCPDSNSWCRGSLGWDRCERTHWSFKKRSYQLCNRTGWFLPLHTTRLDWKCRTTRLWCDARVTSHGVDFSYVYKCSQVTPKCVKLRSKYLDKQMDEAGDIT